MFFEKKKAPAVSNQTIHPVVAPREDDPATWRERITIWYAEGHHEQGAHLFPTHFEHDGNVGSPHRFRPRC